MKPNNVYQGDCIEGLAKIEPGSVDLAFADPPFNIGYEYDVYVDNRSSGEYLNWTRKWMSGVWQALKPSGTFWLAIGDEYAAELKVLAQNEIGFTCRSWVIWYYTFGVNCARSFSRSHTHLLYFVKDANHFTFNAENPTIRVPSARQLVYADGRANPRGRLPDNTWVLRPQDLPSGFQPNDDIWYFARVAGTFKEREGFHGCQMPEQLLGRILRACSNPMEVVLDPFGGSGTTFTVAKKLGRQWIGFELSEEYVGRIRSRVAHANVGDPLDGPADPVSSAPPTALGKRRNSPAARVAISGGDSQARLHRSDLSREVKGGVAEAFKAVHGGWSADHLLAEPQLNAAFIDACAKLGLPGSATQWNLALLNLRKVGKLPRAEKRVRVFSREQMDAYSFASEIAVQQLSAELGATLDTILCDPCLAARFDEISAAYAPGFGQFEYRWAAFTLRKRAKDAKRLARNEIEKWRQIRLPPARLISAGDWSRYDCPGVYLLSSRAERLYVGDTHNLRERIVQIGGIPSWMNLGLASVNLIPQEDRLAPGLKSFLVQQRKPTMNYVLFASDVEDEL